MTVPTINLVLVALLWRSYTRAQTTEAIGTKVQDISTYPAFSQQKSCAMSCFQYGFNTCWEDTLGVAIGCAQKACQPKNGLARNDCYCSAGLMGPAQEYLSNCVSSKCSVGDVSVDVNSATSIYARYCNEKNYFAGTPVSRIASQTGSLKTTPRSTGTGAPAQTGAATTDNGGASAAGSPGSSSLSVGTIIGIVVGACAGLAFLAAAAWIFWRLLKSCGVGRKPPQQEQPSGFQQQPVYPPMPMEQPWYPSPGPASEVGPSDSVSMVGGIARPAPTLVSDMRSQGPGWR